MSNVASGIEAPEELSASDEHPLAGSSAAMCQLRELIAKVARSPRPVLVTGPTGAGKELVVREIHRLSSRSHLPFLDLNCAAIPDTLMEAQLFGHERGAFTGADRRRDGYLAAVGQGTLFLDELAELGQPLQARLLRVLETRTYRRLGSVVSEEFRGRIVAATHADLEERVQSGKFREDLLYRLNVLIVHVPSLDERRADIPDLVRHFAKSQGRELIFSEDAMALLSRASWPGNVRQLRNTVDRVGAMVDENPITASALRSVLGLCAAPTTTIAPIEVLAARILQLDVDDKITAIRNALVVEALRQSQGNKAQAARLLGVHRKVVERRVSSSPLAPAVVADSGPQPQGMPVDFDLLD